MKTQTMNTRANQLSALQATVLTQVLSALGSYAQQMLNKSNVPVLIIHPKEVFVMGSFRTQGSAY